MNKFVIFEGVLGSGKSTQCKIFCTNNAYSYLSTGEIFRGMAKNNEIDEKLTSRMNNGYLLSDELTNSIVTSEINKLESNYIALDGYPRTLKQAEYLFDLINTRINSKLLCVFSLDLADDVIFSRLTARRLNTLNDRADDDNGEIIRHRITEYYEYRDQLHKYYKVIQVPLFIIDANSKIDAIQMKIQNYYNTL